MSEIAAFGSTEEYYRKGSFSSSMRENVRNPVDSKIQCMVLSQIQRAHPNTLLASATSPRVVIDLIPGIALPTYRLDRRQKEVRKEKRARVSFKQSCAGSLSPIGLIRCDQFPPLNAILQLFLFLPAFRDLFSFAPRTYQMLTDFIEQYASDQEKKRIVSIVDSNQLLRLLVQKMPPHFFRFKAAKVEVKDFLCCLIKIVFGEMAPPISNSLAFHPEWNVLWNSQLPFSCAIDLPSRPSELFVTVKNSNEDVCPLIQRQFFTKPDSYCYDLDAFIEYRPDGKENHGDHIVYLKSEGGWYQCDDDRITPMRSTHLNMPLNRSILLHYKRIWPK